MIRQLRRGGLLVVTVSGLAIVSALTPAPAALATTQSYAWTGAGSSPNWSIAANWSSGLGLQANQTYDLGFDNLSTCDSATSTCYASNADVPVTVGELSIDDNLPYRIGASNSAQVTLLGSSPGGSASASTGISATPGTESPSGTTPVISAPIVIPATSAQTWDIAGDSSGHQQSLEVDNINTSSPLDVNLTEGASLVTKSITGGQTLSVSGGAGPGTTANGTLRFEGSSGSSLDAGSSISLSNGASVDVTTSGTVSAGGIDFADNSGGELTIGSGQAPDTVLSSDGNVTFNSGIDMLALSLDGTCPSSGCAAGADNSELTSSGTIDLAGAALVLSQGTDSKGFCDDLAVGQTYTLVSAAAVTETFGGPPNNPPQPIAENCGLGPLATPTYVQLNYTGTAVTATVTAVGDAGDIPQNTGALPAISNKSRSGTSIIAGDTLFVTRGTWNVSNSTDPQTKLSYNYVWMRCPASGGCTPISGPSSSSYTTSASDVGDTIYAEVTATNTLGNKQVSSAKVGPVLPVVVPAAASAPTISGAATLGSILTVTSKGTWTGQPTPSYKYQWLLCSADQASSCAPTGAAGSTKTTLTLTAADLGKYVAAAVSASNRGGTTLATSNLVGRVVPTRGAVLRALAQLRHPSSRKAIQALIAHRSFRTNFAAPSGGRLSITWKTTVTSGRGKHRRHRRITVASGSARYASLGPQQITIRLTRAGRTLLTHKSRGIHIAATEAFAPIGGTWITLTRHFTL